MSRVALFVAVTCAFLVALFAPRTTYAIERNFAGSAQLDYHFVPTGHHGAVGPGAFDGFTIEASAKVAVDVSEHLSANVKLCFGCHGFELDMAHLDYRVSDELAFRVGRFSPSFGSFNLRHDPANQRLSDKPLAYDMGRMIRLRSWNMGVLPSPFPDNGVEANGKFGLGGASAFEYAAYAVSGFKGDPRGLDFDFRQSRDGNLYYVDDNARPASGGRLALSLALGSASDMTFGVSGMYGTYDTANDFNYVIVGSDLTVRVERTNVRLEWVGRRQEVDTRDPTQLRYEVGTNGNIVVKHAGFIEIEHPLAESVDLVVRGDAMQRLGNVLAVRAGSTLPEDGQLTKNARVLRGTLGTAISIEHGLRLKASTELWQFSDPDAAGKTLAVGIHLGMVGAF